MAHKYYNMVHAECGHTPIRIKGVAKSHHSKAHKNTGTFYICCTCNKRVDKNTVREIK